MAMVARLRLRRSASHDERRSDANFNTILQFSKAFTGDGKTTKASTTVHLKAAKHFKDFKFNAWSTSLT